MVRSPSVGLKPLSSALVCLEDGSTGCVEALDDEVSEGGVDEVDATEQEKGEVIMNIVVLSADEGDRVLIVERSRQKDELEAPLPRNEKRSLEGSGNTSEARFSLSGRIFPTKHTRVQENIGEDDAF
ncbi:hypothetical protein U1Q18_005780 [Sarracenia purpurea var. burkii]